MQGSSARVNGKAHQPTGRRTVGRTPMQKSSESVSSARSAAPRSQSRFTTPCPTETISSRAFAGAPAERAFPDGPASSGTTWSPTTSSPAPEPETETFRTAEPGETAGYENGSFVVPV